MVICTINQKATFYEQPPSQGIFVFVVCLRFVSRHLSLIVVKLLKLLNHLPEYIRTEARLYPQHNVNLGGDAKSWSYSYTKNIFP